MNPGTPKPPATQSWVRFRSIAYLTGRGLAFGVGDDIFPKVATAPGKFSINTDIMPNPNVAVCDGRVDVFQDGVFDHLVVGPMLGVAPNPAALFRELASKLRTGGHVVMYFRTDQAHPAVTTIFTEDSAFQLLTQAGAWRMKYSETRGTDVCVIAKKVAGSRGTMYPIRPKAAKRACICRYGALGDMVMITPLIKQLAADGYEVTMNITPYAAPVLDGNPYVSNIIIQEREAIPNKDLGQYWAEWATDYDRYINLSESIEGKLLKVEGRRDFFTTQAHREATCGSTNYYDQTMMLGGYSELHGTRGEMFFSPAERREAETLRKEYIGKILIGWGVNGSSHHKKYPLAAPVLDDWLSRHPDVVVFLLGGPEAAGAEWDHPQVVRTCGKWPLRKTIAFISLVADVMFGPESMAMNVAACYNRPKILLLSHSNPTNLCKYWTNTQALEPDRTIAPCYPCHQLHYSLESCPQAEIRDKETGEIVAAGPLCAMGAIDGYRVMAALDTAVAAVGVAAVV